MPRPKSSGLSREEDDRLRRTRLLDAAAEIFFKMGYEAASTAAIAARAHASKRALYTHFKSKDDLFMAVIDARTASIAERVSVLFEGERPIRETLFAVAVELLRSLLSQEHTALMRLVYTQAFQLPEAAQFMTERGPDRGVTKLAAHLRKQTARGVLKIQDAQIAAEQFAGLLIGDLVHRAMLGQQVPRTERQFETRAKITVEAFLRIYS